MLWVDSDLVDYPADLVPRLHAIAPDGIAAPWVELDRYPGRFYDIGGFIERGRRFGVAPPLCPAGRRGGPGQRGVRLPSRRPPLTRRGALRPPPTDYYVEHWSAIAQAARASAAYPVRATRALTARHAFLPDSACRSTEGSREAIWRSIVDVWDDVDYWWTENGAPW